MSPINNTLGSIDGATALKLDESLEIQDETQNSVLNDSLNNSNEASVETIKTSNNFEEVPTGVSIESASYIENSSLEDKEETLNHNSISDEEEYTPKLFSDEIFRLSKFFVKFFSIF